MAYFTIEGYNSYSGCDITVTASLPPINGTPINKYYSLGSLQTLSISTHQDKRPVRSLGVINAKDYVMGPRTIAGSMVFAVFNKHFATEIMRDLGAEGASVILPDEIPALNITINFANEYGRMSRMAIYGVKIVNEGQVMSINDLYTENTYQFVALGLEPLNVNINSDGKDDTPNVNKDPIDVNPDSEIREFDKYDPLQYTSDADGMTIPYPPLGNRVANYDYIGNDVVVIDTTNSTSALLNNKYFTNNSGANLADRILNNAKADKDNALELNITNSYNPITLSVTVEQPASINDTGLAIFVLNPEQVDGTIYVYPTNSKNPDEDYRIDVDSRRSLVLSLPVGKYQAQYINNKAETSNKVDFTIEKYIESQVSDYITNYPVVEKVTDTSITISSSDYSHNTAVCFEEGKQSIISDIGKKAVTITGLVPNTEYNIFTNNNANSSGSRSQIVTVKTYETKDQEVDMLKEFVDNNKNLLLTIELDEDNDIFEEYDYEDYNTLIDLVLDMPESHQKQELLIYATELTNQLNTSHNISNKVHIENDIQKDPFTSVITLNNFEFMNVYNANNKKSTLNTTLNATTESFCAKAGKHYSINGVTSNNSKSVKKNFVVCKNSSSPELDRYREVELYKDIDLSEYESSYMNCSYSTVEAIAIRNKHYSDIDILEPPYIYQDDDNTVYANVNYLNLNRYENYYLCCSELYSALDYSPVRKIRFNMESAKTELNLKDYYLGLTPNNKYLFWIEDSGYLKISKPFLYVNNSRDEFYDLKTIYKTELYSKLLALKKDMIRAYGNRSVINELFDYVYSLEPPQKDFYTVLTMELINALSNSYYVSSTLEPLYELVKTFHTYNNIKNIPNIQIDKTERTVTFEELNGYYICAIDFDTTVGEASRLTEDYNTVRYNKEGFTLIYLISHNMMYKTGFILINNANGSYKCTADLIDYVKEVGDK